MTDTTKTGETMTDAEYGERAREALFLLPAGYDWTGVTGMDSGERDGYAAEVSS